MEKMIDGLVGCAQVALLNLSEKETTSGSDWQGTDVRSVLVAEGEMPRGRSVGIRCGVIFGAPQRLLRNGNRRWLHSRSAAGGIVTHNVNMRDLGRGQEVFDHLRVLTPARCLEEWY